ncbi:MAG TPA: hypothetical protein VF285_00880 [Castellaniella sp.]|uniref:hypothetical protein n=1 Tax=Castellaniella sp. TaxID=1955812 RepID=UPI002F110F88
MATPLMNFKPHEARDLGKLPARTISDLEWTMSEGLVIQLYSADGQRSVDVHCAELQQAMNECVVLAEACQISLITLGDLLDQMDRVRRNDSVYARMVIEGRIPDPYWRERALRIVELAPEGSGTREALRYLLATVHAHHVLY